MTGDNACEAESLEAALSRSLDVLPADLVRVMKAWPRLPNALKAAVLAMIDAAE